MDHNTEIIEIINLLKHCSRNPLNISGKFPTIAAHKMNSMHMYVNWKVCRIISRILRFFNNVKFYFKYKVKLVSSIPQKEDSLILFSRMIKGLFLDRTLKICLYIQRHCLFRITFPVF